MRTIVVDGVEWKYKIGRQHIRAKCTSAGLSRVGDFKEITGLDWDTIERGQWKKYFSITPQQVADWLRKPS